MSMRLLLGMGAIIFAGSQALAQTDTPAPAPVPEKKICKSFVPTGSIMSKRVCLTKTEWKEFDGANENAVEAFRRKPGGVCGSTERTSCE